MKREQKPGFQAQATGQTFYGMVNQKKIGNKVGGFCFHLKTTCFEILLWSCSEYCSLWNPMDMILLFCLTLELMEKATESSKLKNIYHPCCPNSWIWRSGLHPSLTSQSWTRQTNPASPRGQSRRCSSHNQMNPKQNMLLVEDPVPFLKLAKQIGHLSTLEG